MLDTNQLYSLEAEAGVIGSMVIDEGCISPVVTILHDSQMFFETRHQILYEALFSLYIDEKPTDAIMLRTELIRLGKLKEIGGVEYIQRLIESVPSAANAVYYAKIVKERYHGRKMLTAIADINKVQADVTGLNDQIGRIQEIALSLEVHSDRPSFIDFSSAPEIVELLKEHTGVISTGFKNIDAIIQGFCPCELIVIAGRPSMGKSALMLDIALNMAAQGVGILIFTLEMPEKGIIERAVCNLTEMNLAQVKSGFLPDLNFDKIKAKAEEVKNLPITLSSSCSTVEQQIAMIRKLKQARNIGCVFIDYLQLMHVTGKAENRQQAISSISRKLKLTAIQENLPIVALSQLNRAVETRDKHRPRMSDLRESGSIEQDADLVILLHREDYYRRASEPDSDVDGSADVIIAKNRRGPTGVAQLVFLDNYCKFADMSYLSERQ